MSIERVLRNNRFPYLMRGGFQRVAGLLSRNYRLVPDFLIIGAQRAGTTSLFHSLAKHPQIYPSFPKETHYFSLYFSKGIEWYRSHFPLIWTKNRAVDKRGLSFLTGEATPYYLFHPLAPRRVHKTLSDIRIIAMLRNPIERAYSHYHHEVKLGVETLSFEDALDNEEERISSDWRRIGIEDDVVSFNFQHYSYLSRGIYIDQLTDWIRLFGRESILILKSEDFFANSSSSLKVVLDFLGLQTEVAVTNRIHNKGQYQRMNSDTRDRLQDYFYPHNQRLYDYLDKNFGWEEE